MVYGKSGNILSAVFDKNGSGLNSAYDKNGNVVFHDALPVPSGNLTASSTVPLPDIYNNGHGWTCTGLTYDSANNQFLVGDIGKALPSSSGFASQIVKVSTDFLTVKGTIDLHTAFPNMQDVQGITLDADDTIWFCSPSENRIRHIDLDGNDLGSLYAAGGPTGIAYSHDDDSLWVLTYGTTSNIKRVSKTGATLEKYTFAYSDTLDQCFLDSKRGYLYITAGANYNSRNNIYLFNTVTHQQSVACTVDSYSVEGLWIGKDTMVIVNDGYYHSAAVPINQANFYTLT